MLEDLNMCVSYPKFIHKEHMFKYATAKMIVYFFIHTWMAANE